jgi:hypothetical protein
LCLLGVSILTAGVTDELMERYDLKLGGVYELNNQAKHYVSNWGEDCRTHLIFDYVEANIARPPLEVVSVVLCFIFFTSLPPNQWMIIIDI